MAIQTQTFPGVYPTVKDSSFVPALTSRYHAGLIGPAEKGPFDTAVGVRSLKDYRAKFGRSIPGSYVANAVALLADISDGTSVVRVGHQYRAAAVQNASGSENGYTVSTPDFAQFSDGDYIRVTQPGKASTVNARVSGAPASGAITLTSSGNEAKPLAATYANATVSKSALAEAANPAEAFLKTHTYGSPLARLGQAVGDKSGYKFSLTGYGSNLTPWQGGVTSITKVSGGTVATVTTPDAHGLATGDRVSIIGSETLGYNGSFAVTVTNSTQFTYTVASNLSPTTAVGTSKFLVLQPGDLILIEQTDRATTREVRVAELRVGRAADTGILAVDPVILLETSDLSEVGYKSLALQDSYTAAQIKKVVASDGVAMHLKAASAGTWANSDGSKTGLIVNVSPGSSLSAGKETKKFEIYEDSSLVETIDNLSAVKKITDPTTGQLVDNPDYFLTRINGKSAAIIVEFAADGTASGQCAVPANTVNPWNRSLASPLNIAAFNGGYNGASPQDSDYIGALNPNDDTQSGLKAFDDSENLDLSTICAPGNTSIAVAQEIARIARKVNASGYVDSPQGLNAREATDWHNGAGLYAFRGKLDTYSLSCFFNWGTVVDPFDGRQKQVPPTLAAMRATARTFDREKPWFAAAGEVRGVIPELLAVEFPRISEDARNGMYGAGNSLNPVMLFRNRIMVYGDRTMQRADSKLTATHSVHLVNYMVKGMSARGRQFVFDPNDSELLLHLRLIYSDFLDSIVNERGLEDYLLQIDSKNNTPTTRNDRAVIVDLSFVPTDVMERLYLNLTVRESGAVLNSTR